jgi:hypothetical protein
VLGDALLEFGNSASQAYDELSRIDLVFTD